MRTRRTVMAGVATTITLTGCSQQGSQPTEEQTGDADTGEFSLEEFRVDGNLPSEYDAQFISGASPDAAADEFSPQFSYSIAGTSKDVETELHVTHSPETIPKEELDETRKGETHTGSGEYQQNIPLPDSVIEMFAETPRNLEATFRATDTQTEQTETRTFAMNYGNSYAEQIVQEAFSQNKIRNSDGLNSVNVDDGIFEVKYSSTAEPGNMEFDQGLSFLGGIYTGFVADTRIPMRLELEVEYSDRETYRAEINDDMAKEYLNGEIREGTFSTKVGAIKLPTSH